MVLIYINLSQLQSIVPVLPDNILENPLIKSVVACIAILEQVWLLIGELIYGVPTIMVGCVIDIINWLLLSVYSLDLYFTVPINLLINIIEQCYSIAIFITIISQSELLLVLGMENVPIGHPNYIPVPGYPRPNSLGPPRPYPAPGIQEPKEGVIPRPSTPKPRFGDPGL